MVIGITGINRGLGKYLVNRLKKEGNYTIIGIDQFSQDQIHKGTAKLLDYYYPVDLRNLKQVNEAIEKIISEHYKIDFWINNAGIKLFGKFENYDVGNIIDLINVNFTSAIILTKHLLNQYPDIQIINISSQTGFHGARNASLYSASKSAMIVFTEALSKEFQGNNHVFVICPSTIATDEFLEAFPDTKLQKFITPEKLYFLIMRILDKKEKRSIILLNRRVNRIKILTKNLIKFFRWI